MKFVRYYSFPPSFLQCYFKPSFENLKSFELEDYFQTRINRGWLESIFCFRSIYTTCILGEIIGNNMKRKNESERERS